MADVNVSTATLQDVVALGQQIGKVNADGVEIPYAVVPATSKVVSLLEYKHPYGLPPRRPDHIKATAELTDTASFCQYVKLYADARTRIFADPDTFRFRAILDYHRAPQLALTDGKDSGDRVSAGPEFLDHQATFTMKPSPQWELWIGKNEKLIAQSEFAEFLEDNYRDISTPSAADMLEVARDLTAHVDVNFASKVTPKNGATQFAYTETVTTGQVGQAGSMEVPDRFTILIPVFFGEKPVNIDARLRFRISQNKLSFMYKLYRPIEVQSDAFRLAVSEISDTLGMAVLMGGV